MDKNTPTPKKPETEKKTRVRSPRQVAGPNKHTARQIQLLRKQAGMTQAELAKKVEVAQATISKWELGIDLPGATQAARLALVLGVTANELLGIGAAADMPAGRRVKVVGELAAGAWRETIDMQDQYDVLVAVPKKFEHVPLQGFVVKGESMNRIYPDGSIVYVAPIHAVEGWPRSGQVVMVMAHEHGMTEATLKEYVVNEHGKWLYPRSNHPEHQAPVDYKNKKGEVAITGVVVSAMVFPE
jgi:transcriptional regulator with XRE-family HTH domain